ncbi:hypothetical protein ABT001_22165 [Streptomyces sp. NPDC002793]|uniref:hypothetical protein n=1 Tax=Streptomyces sp. NPDC002793 TaxID=3154432 RepID=UPI00331BA04C
MSDWMPGPDTAQRGETDEAAATPPAATPAPTFDPVPPTPLGVARTPTGHPGVDARLERLADADHLAADGHTEVYEDVHRGLRDELTALDARPAPAPTHDHRS